MPRGTRRNYTKVPRSTREKERALTDPEFAKEQEKRSPSERLSSVPKCGARLSKKTTTDQVADADTDPYCKMPAGHGTSHPGFGYCKFHGGNTPSGKKAGARAMGRAIIEQRRSSAAFGDRNDPALASLTPEQALLEEVRRSVALVRWLEEKISAWEFIDLDELSERDQAAVANIRGLGLPALTAETFKGTPYATDVHSWLTLYREERDHMVRVSKLTIDAGIQERQVRLAEQQGLLLSSVIRQILAALSLSPEQHELVPQVVPQIIRSAVASAATIQGELSNG